MRAMCGAACVLSGVTVPTVSIVKSLAAACVRTTSGSGLLFTANVDKTESDDNIDWDKTAADTWQHQIKTLKKVIKSMFFYGVSMVRSRSDQTLTSSSRTHSLVLEKN